MDDFAAIQIIKSLPPKVRDQLNLQIALTGKVPDAQELIKLQRRDARPMGKTKGGKAISDALAKSLPMCKPRADGTIETKVGDNIVCRDDILNFKEKCPAAYNTMLTVVGGRWIHWNMWMLNELIVNWRANRTDTLHRLLMKLAYLSAVVVTNTPDGSDFMPNTELGAESTKLGANPTVPFYYPIENLDFIMWLMQFYAPVELQYDAKEMLIPGLKEVRTQKMTYVAEAVRNEVNDKLAVSALVAASVPGQCKPDPARMGKSEPPYDPNQCIAMVRMGGDFRLYYSKPNIGKNGQILKGGAAWKPLSPKMKEPTMLQVLQGAEYKTTRENDQANLKAFQQNTAQITEAWKNKLNSALQKFTETGQKKHLEEFSSLAKLNPLDQSIAISKRIQVLDAKEREKFLDIQRGAQQRSVLNAMKTGAYDNAAFNTKTDKGVISAYANTPLGDNISQNLDPMTLAALKSSGKASRQLAKGGKKPTLKKQNMKFANPLPKNKALEQQLLLQALGLTPDVSGVAGGAGDGFPWGGEDWRS